jgi:hypothetical protein
MTTTTNLNLKKPDADDFYNVEDMNDNSDVLDTEVSKRAVGEGLTFSIHNGCLRVSYDDGE